MPTTFSPPSTPHSFPSSSVPSSSKEQAFKRQQPNKTKQGAIKQGKKPSYQGCNLKKFEV